MRIKALSLVLSLLVLSGCGYKPSSTFYKSSFKGSVFVDVDIDLMDTQNSVYINDIFNQMIVERFQSRLEDRDRADSIIEIKINDVKFKPLLYDEKGYVSIYRAVVSIYVRYNDRDGVEMSRSYDGRYDFSVDNASIITESNRYEAIKFASHKALEIFISNISAMGNKNDN